MTSRLVKLLSQKEGNIQMKNKVLSLFTFLTLGTVSVQPFTKTDLEKVMNISGIVATAPNIAQLINGEDEAHLRSVGTTSQFAYDWTSAALESGISVERLDRFVMAIMKGKQIPEPTDENPAALRAQGNILEGWNNLNVVKSVGLAVATQFLKEVCNEVSGNVISYQLPEDKQRIIRRVIRTLCIPAIEGGVDALQALVHNKFLKAENAEDQDLLKIFTDTFLKTVAGVATGQIIGEILIQECEDDATKEISIKDILNFRLHADDNDTTEAHQA